MAGAFVLYSNRLAANGVGKSAVSVDAKFAPLKSAAAIAAATESHTCASVQSPQVEVERDGTRVTLIRVTCPCGEVIELACDY